MRGRRRVFSVEPLWKRGSTWRPAENCVVLTSVSMFRHFQAPKLEVSFSLELDGKMSNKVDRWGEAESPTESVPHKVGFSPMSGRLLKSESEDSGMEMTSSDHSPSSPVRSERSFFSDFMDGFQPSVEESALPAPYEVMTAPIQDCTFRQDLSVSEDAALQSQKCHLPCSPPPLSQNPHNVERSEGSSHVHWPTSIDDLLEMTDGDSDMSLGCRSPEGHGEQVKVKSEPTYTSPGQGLLYLEHICQMMEKIAQLQQANLQLQRQQKRMQRRIRDQEFAKKGFIEETPESPGLTGMEFQMENSAATELEEAVTAEASNPWDVHHFRTRSASDTRALRRPAHSLGSKTICSRKATLQAVSSPALDQLDGVSHTLPPGMKLKGEHSHWCRIKGLFNRIARKSVRSSEPTSCHEPPPSTRQNRVDTVMDKQESHRRWRFLSNLGASRHRSKHLSMQ